MPQIKNIGIEFSFLGDNDLIPVQRADGVTGRAKKSTIVAGLPATVSTANPILTNTNLIAYWDAENVITFDTGITEFIDRSNSNKNAYQGTNNLRCSLVNNVINAKPIARFTGSQYYSHSATNDPLTIIAAVRNSSTAAHRTLLGADASSGSGLGAYYFKTTDPTPRMSFVRAGLSNTVVDALPISSDKFYVQSSRNRGTVLELFIDNLLINSVVTSGTPLTISNPLLGAGYFNGGIVDYFAGDVHTIALFNSALSDSLLITYINYLRDYLKL